MPQNKVTSRIAAITGKLAVALAALLAPAILIAETISVTFDAALTNETGWVYSDIATDKDGNIYFKLSSSVQSPTFSFNITSVEITLSCTSTEPSRILQIIPSSGVATNATSVAKADAKETQIFEFDKTDTARSFSIRLTGSSNTGNWYIYSAVISGVPLIEAPTDLQANDIKGTRFRLSWENPETAMSNRVAVFRVDRHSESGTTLDEYDFTAFTNTSKNAKDCYSKDTLKMDVYNAFCGTNIYAAGNSTGVVQISNPDAQGWLRYDFGAIRESLDEATNAFLAISAAKHPADAATGTRWKLLASQIDDAGATSKSDEIAIDGEFPESPYMIFIQDWTSCNAIDLRPSDSTKGDRRILIKSFAIIKNHVPADIETNLVKTAFVADSTTYSVRGLCPRTGYVARITAFDADGNESSPSEPLAVTTNGEALPFSIRIQ